MYQNFDSHASSTNNKAFQPSRKDQQTQTAEYEISQFMKNFAHALCDGNAEEIATYYADNAKKVELPELLPIVDVNDESQFELNPLFLNQKISAEERFGIFSALVCLRGLKAQDYAHNGGWHLLTCVLDKTEGYWEIVQVKHGALV